MGRWREARTFPFDGGLSVHIDDITETQQLHEELAERESMFRSLAENSADIIVRYNRDLRVLYANPAIERA